MLNVDAPALNVTSCDFRNAYAYMVRRISLSHPPVHKLSHRWCTKLNTRPLLRSQLLLLCC